ncbi:MAG: YebC/PmpR family DNA-binding transcriptional regulator [Caulobacterales bacterium]|jgi:YebC/PmpR family DNA-binding regulatory protein
MAGHSAFKNIMHKKGAADKKRAALFTKIARELQIAAKLGGADPSSNPRLRAAMANARAEQMPKDNIQRAIDRGGGKDAETLEEIRYEGFGPGGVGIIVEAATDNRNRTAGDVRAAFAKNGGALGETNSVSFGWDRIGEIRFPLKVASEDGMLEAAIEAGADDCQAEMVEEAEEHVVTCAMNALPDVTAALSAKFGEPKSAKIIWRPQVTIPVAGDQAQALLKLLDILDDLDDVQHVFANFDLDAAELAKLAG